MTKSIHNRQAETTEGGYDRTKRNRPTAFSLLVHTEPLLPTWLFLKKSRTSLNLTVQSRSENALEPGKPW